MGRGVLLVGLGLGSDWPWVWEVLVFTWASLESGLVRSGFSFGSLCLFETLAWDFKSRSRSLRLALRSASCLCFVRLSGVV